MKHEIRNICPASLGKVLGAIFFCFLAILSMVEIIVIAITRIESGSADGGWYPGLGQKNDLILFLLYPFLGGLFGVILGHVLAWAYNVVTRIIGGIEITLKE